MSEANEVPISSHIYKSYSYSGNCTVVEKFDGKKNQPSLGSCDPKLEFHQKSIPEMYKIYISGFKTNQKLC